MRGVLAGVLVISGAVLQSQQDQNGSREASSLDVTLAASEAREVNLEPGADRRIAITVAAEQLVVVTLEQRAGMSKMHAAEEDGKETPVYSSDGGVGSRSLMILSGGSQGLAYQVTLGTREKRRSSVARISRQDLAHPTETDRTIATLDERLAEAETIRRGIEKRSPKDAEALYDAVIAKSKQLADSHAAAPDGLPLPETLERQAWTGKCRLLAYREENYLGALEAAQHAVEISSTNAEDSVDIGDRALAWKSYSSALALLNRYDEAIQANLRAMALYEKMGDEYWQGVVAGNLAFIYRETGQSQPAMEWAARSLHLAELQKDDYGRAFALSAEGAIAQGSGDYQTALDRYYQALDVLKQWGKGQLPFPAEGEIWSNMGALYADLNDWGQAENAYRNALPAVRASADAVSEIETEGELAAVESHSGKLAHADRDYTAALAKATHLGLLREGTHLLTGLARTRSAENQRDALSLFKQAESEAHTIGQLDGEAEAASGMADFYSGEKNSADARHAYARAAELWRAVPNAAEVAKAEANLARTDMQDGQLESARGEILAALDQVEQARETLVSKSLRTSYFSSRHSYYELAVEILMRLDGQEPAKGYAEEAWTVAERARARTLLDMLNGKSGAASSSPRQQALDLHIQETEEKLAHLGTGPEDAAKAEAAAKELHALLLEADRAAQEARSQRLEKAPDATSAAAHGEGLFVSLPNSAARTRQALGAGDALYEYWTGASKSYLWVITAEGMKSYALPDSRSLHTLATEFMSALTEREQFETDESMVAREKRIAASDAKSLRLGAKLGQMLMPAGLGPAHRLIVVPDGPLENLPFAALRVADTKGQESRREHYLVERCELVEEPSAATLLHLTESMQAARAATPNDVAVVADPVYSSTDPRVFYAKAAEPAHVVAARMSPSAKQSASTDSTHITPVLLRQAKAEWGMPQLPRLPETRREALAIRDLAGPAHTKLFLGFDANPRALAETDWSHFRVLHIAAHAVVNTEQPELSGLVLSMVDRSGAAENGVVRLYDVYRLHAPLELVVLSACSTSEGKLIRGEGVDGLVRAFLAAGAESVVSTQWGAEDASTSELMQAFYRNYLQANKPGPSALRAAQLKLIASGQYAAPYYWAGIVLDGGWRGR